MKATVKRYTEELYRQFHYYATWLPTSPVELGSIGTFDDREFTRISHLHDQGIEYETYDTPNKGGLDYSSQGAVTVSPKLSGKVPAVGSVLSQADAGFTVNFSRKNAIVFRAKGTACTSIKDQIKLGRDIKKKYEEGKWNKRWVVITELVKADSATILISSSVDGKVELKANANVGAKKLDIADVSLELGIAFEKNIETKIVAEQELTPLFKVRRGRVR